VPDKECELEKQLCKWPKWPCKEIGQKQGGKMPKSQGKPWGGTSGGQAAWMTCGTAFWPMGAQVKTGQRVGGEAAAALMTTRDLYATFTEGCAL
jgi:hypothetical protein